MSDRVNKKARGGRYCVAGTLNNESWKNSGKTKGVRMHQFPSFEKREKMAV